MTKKEILDYVMENPGNTNVSVLGPMVDAVSGVTPTGKITITENGSDIDVAQYAKADVTVPNPSTGTLPITANGTYNVASYASAEVNVSGSTPNYKTVTVNVVSYLSDKTEIGIPSASNIYFNAIEIPVEGGSCQVPCIQAIQDYYVSYNSRRRYVGFFMVNNYQEPTNVSINTGEVVVPANSWKMPIKNGSTEDSRMSKTKAVLFTFVAYSGSPDPVITITYGTPPEA